MPTLHASFDDAKSAEVALERLDEAGFPLGTFRLLARYGRSLPAILERILVVAKEVARRSRHDQPFVVEVQGDARALEAARRILEGCGGRVRDGAP